MLAPDNRDTLTSALVKAVLDRSPREDGEIPKGPFVQQVCNAPVELALPKWRRNRAKLSARSVAS